MHYSKRHWSKSIWQTHCPPRVLQLKTVSACGTNKFEYLTVLAFGICHWKRQHAVTTRPTGRIDSVGKVTWKYRDRNKKMFHWGAGSLLHGILRLLYLSFWVHFWDLGSTSFLLDSGQLQARHSTCEFGCSVVPKNCYTPPFGSWVTSL